VPAERVKGRRGNAEDVWIRLSAAGLKVVDRRRELEVMEVFPDYRGLLFSPDAASMLMRDACQSLTPEKPFS